jgi:hypothetical protein
MELIELLKNGLIRTWHNHNFLVHMQFTNENYIADAIEEAIQVANMTQAQQETLSAYLDVFQEVEDKTIIDAISADEMFLTGVNTMTDYAKKWIKEWAIKDEKWEVVAPYIDFKAFGALLYADGCYIKTPKGIIERL